MSLKSLERVLELLQNKAPNDQTQAIIAYANLLRQRMEGTVTLEQAAQINAALDAKYPHESTTTSELPLHWAFAEELRRIAEQNTAGLSRPTNSEPTQAPLLPNPAPSIPDPQPQPRSRRSSDSWFAPNSAWPVNEDSVCERLNDEYRERE